MTKKQNFESALRELEECVRDHQMMIVKYSRHEDGVEWEAVQEATDALNRARLAVAKAR